MAGPRIHERPEHDLATARGGVGLPPVENRLDLLALQPVLRAAEITGNDRVFHLRGELFAVGLGHMGKGGAVDEQIAFLVDQFRRHGGQPPPP